MLPSGEVISITITSWRSDVSRIWIGKSNQIIFMPNATCSKYGTSVQKHWNKASLCDNNITSRKVVTSDARYCLM